jgi:hypothetical protein
MRYFGLILGILILFSFSFVSAATDYTFSKKSIQTTYSSEELIKGEFNLTLKNSPNLIFSSSLGGNISVVDLLKNSSYVLGEDYFCNPVTCKGRYSKSNPQTSRVVELTEDKIIGFSVIGRDIELNSFSFNLSSTIPSSCINQLRLNILNDDSIDLTNTNYIDETCSIKNYGCFDNTKELNSFFISASPYCEKITLPAAPAFRLGANISGPSTTNLVMELYNYADSEKLGECNLPNISQSGQDYSCIVNYSAMSQFDSFVCIKSKSGNQNTIRSEASSSDELCGMQSPDSSQEPIRDYEVFAQSLRYAPFSGKGINLDLSDINDYLLSEYSSDGTSVQCPDPGCIIPAKISGFNQNLTISNIQIKYFEQGGLTSSDKVYDLSSGSVKINSSTLNLNFESLGFKAPVSGTQKLFKLYLGDDLLFSQSINITTSFNFDINPKVAVLAQTTNFVATLLNSSGNITYSSWNFGDGSTGTANGNTISHKYASEGTYAVSVELTKSDLTKSSKTFTIVSGDPKTSANLTLSKYSKRIADISSNLNSFAPWTKAEIEKAVNLSSLNSTLAALSRQYALATNTSDYVAIVTSLSTLSVPLSIKVTEKGDLLLSGGYANMDLSYLEEILSNTINDSEKVKLNLIDWMEKNYNFTATYEVISQLTDSEPIPILTKVLIRISPKNDKEEARYLILGYPKASITFKESYSPLDVADGAATYISLDGAAKQIEFSVSGKVSPVSLGAYLSPEDVSRFDFDVGEGQGYPWTNVIIILIIVFIIFFVIYGILQIWYKRHYENYLFKNSDDLFNLINFIYNSRVSGLKDSEIRNKLGKAGWSGERLTYAFKKIDGKRTGMFEIPIFNIFDTSRTVKEIEKRHPEGIDKRFIKRPDNKVL